MHYNQSFRLTENLGNNALSFEKRKKTKTPKLFVPKLIQGDINNVKIGENIVFEDFDIDKKGNEYLISAYGLENFVKTSHQETPVYIFDNHNHALYFWYLEYINGSIGKENTLIHIDQHSDMNDNPYKINNSQEKDLNYIREYTNYYTNVGNYIKPTIENNFIKNNIQITTEHSIKENMDKGFENLILNIDLDFWAPNLEHIDKDLKNSFVKKLLPQAKVITIATSPFFIDQEKAIKVLKEILN